jgi:hypothetical protein
VSNRTLRQLLQDFAKSPEPAVPMVKLPLRGDADRRHLPTIKPVRRRLNENTRTLRAERRFLLMRYDSYGLPPAIYQVLLALECELAWRQHREARHAEAQ